MICTVTINYGLNFEKDKYSFDLSQSYEFQKNSNYKKEVGNQDYLTDTLGSFKFSGEKTGLIYNLRFNNDQGKINNQSIDFSPPMDHGHH